MHTPTPWTTKPGRIWICTVGNNSDDPGIWSEYPVRPGESFPNKDKKADAEFIVRAANSHKALVAAAEAFVAAVDRAKGQSITFLDGDPASAITKARAALKLARQP
jgi:hypothetical protein